MKVVIASFVLDINPDQNKATQGQGHPGNFGHKLVPILAVVSEFDFEEVSDEEAHDSMFAKSDWKSVAAHITDSSFQVSISILFAIVRI